MGILEFVGAAAIVAIGAFVLFFLTIGICNFLLTLINDPNLWDI